MCGAVAASGAVRPSQLALTAQGRRFDTLKNGGAGWRKIAGAVEGLAHDRLGLRQQRQRLRFRERAAGFGDGVQ